MIVRSTVRLPLGEFDVVSREVASTLVGQKVPATDENHARIGNSIVTDVDWRSQNEVWLTIETNVVL